MIRRTLLVLAVAALGVGCTKQYSGKESSDARTVADATLPFVADCKNPSAPPDVKRTVTAVKDALKVADCDAAGALLQRLSRLDLSNLGITNLSPLRDLPNLEEVKLDGNQFTDLEPLGTMPKLQGASFSGGGFARGLASLLRIRRITLDNAGLTDLGDIARLCRSLEFLSLRENKVTNLEPLRQCTALQSLYIDGNNVATLEPLNALKLRVLSADRNRIDSVAPLSGMATLQLLSLQHNPIENLSPISGISTMQTLFPPPAKNDEDNCPTRVSLANVPLRDYCTAARSGG